MQAIALIHTPFTDLAGMPIQPAGAAGVRGTVVVFDEYQARLKDLDGFSHIALLFLFHGSHGFKLEVAPFTDTEPRGVFATRAPRRPNPIGMSLVQLDGIANGTLHIRNVDMLDGTPLLDIKPYVPDYDVQTNVSTGWLERARESVSGQISDHIFTYERQPAHAGYVATRRTLWAKFDARSTRQ